MPTIPYGGVGIAQFDTSDLYSQTELFAGPTPLPVTESFPVAQSTTLAAFAVVGLDGSGNLVMADISDVDPANHILPIGVTTVAVATGVGETDSIAVLRAGNFNPDALTWDASYDTDAKKKAAFHGSPAPTNIFITKTAS